MSQELTGMVYDIQGFSVQDGPGIRTTVFLKGCPLRCPWCHSPESQAFHPQLSWISMRCIGTELCQERCIKALIKFDIQDVGFFDLFFIYGTKSEKISMQINYPKNLNASESQIRTALGKIFADNGIEQGELVLGSEDGSVPISAAFPNIFERKNSVNVTV